MKVLVAGSNGKIGRQLVDLLNKDDEHSVRALVRRPEQAEAFRAAGIEAVVADLEDSVEQLAKVLEGCEGVVFSAGSGGHTGPDKTLLIDLDGAVKMVEAAEMAGVSRFLMVSAIQAHRRENWSNQIKPYFVAKHYADRLLRQSSLTHTVVRPGALLDEPGTGRIAVAEDLERASIPRADVAHTLLACINEPNTFNRSFDLVSGDQPITAALQAL